MTRFFESCPKSLTYVLVLGYNYFMFPYTIIYKMAATILISKVKRSN
jgi:hypothetical protein